jgi:type III pantothenate kinase
MIERTENELGENINIVATGGLSTVIAPLTKHILKVEQLLTLDGLAEICKVINGFSED